MAHDTETNRDATLEKNVEQLLTRAHRPPTMAPEARERVLKRLLEQAADADDQPAPADPPERAGWQTWAGLALAAGLAAAALITAWPTTETTDPAPPALGSATSETPAPGPAEVLPRSTEAKRVTLSDGSTLVVGPGAAIAELGPRHLSVERGDVILDVKKGAGTFTVDTPHGRVVVLGTRFIVSCQTDSTLTSVLRGKVRIENPKGKQLLRAGQEGVLSPTKAPTRRPAPRLSQRTSWARDLLSRPADRPAEPVRRGNLIARAPRWGGEWPLKMRKLALDARVEGGMMRVTLDQTFFNHTNRRLEGVYSFPLPQDAAVSRLAMYVNGKRMEGGIIERQRGRNVYESIVHRRRDPALLEWMAGNELRVRIFPLEPRREKRIVLSWTQPVSSLYGTRRLSIPLPSLDTAIDDVSIRVHVAEASELKVSSRTHELSVARTKKDATATWTGKAVTLDGDLLMELSGPTTKTPSSARFQDPDGHYAMVGLTPEIALERQWRARRWVVLYDTSGSRSGVAALAQRHALKRLLAELDEEDQVAILAFDATRRWLGPGFQAVGDIDLAEVDAHARGDGIGHTDLGAALSEAVERLAMSADDNAQREPHILYLGDGIATAGEKTPAKLAAMIAGRARFVGLGVGSSVDGRVLRSLAESTDGYVTTLSPGEDLDWRVHDLVATLNTPRLSALEARVTDTEGATIPKASVYLSRRYAAHGEELWAVAHAPGGAPAAIEFTGLRAGGAKWSKRVQIAARDDGAGWLPRFWARQRIDALVREGAAVHRVEITRLGMTHFLVTPHTSLLVLETDAMYKRFKVSRAARTRWAPYPAPDKVADVYEPLGARSRVIPKGSSISRRRQPLFQRHYGLRGPQLGLIGHGVGGGGLNFQQRIQLLPGTFTLNLASGLGGDLGGTEVDGTRLLKKEAKGKSASFTVGGEELPTWETGAARGPAKTQPSPDGYLTIVSAPAGAATSWDFKTHTEGLDGRFAANDRGFGWAEGERRVDSWWAAAPAPAGFASPLDARLADLTEWVPGLFSTPLEDTLDRLAALPAPDSDTPAAANAAALVARVRARVGKRRFEGPDGMVLVTDAVKSRYRVERTTRAGLRELTVWDGEVLHRLAPELGIWTTRQVGLAEPMLLAHTAPFLLPSAERLARWYTVTLENERTLRFVRRGATDPKPTRVIVDAQDRIVRVERVEAPENHNVGGTPPQTPRVVVRIEWGPDSVTLRGGGRAKGRTLAMQSAARSPAIGAPNGDGLTRVELPLREESAWKDDLESEDSAVRAHAEAQVLATWAALGKTAEAYTLLARRASAGTLTRGIVALGSRALVERMDAKVAKTLERRAATDPAAAFVRALWDYRRASSSGRAGAAAEAAQIKRDGLLGMLGGYVQALHHTQSGGSTVGALARSRRFTAAFAKRFPMSPLTTIAIQQWTSRWQWRDVNGAIELYESLAKLHGMAPWALDAGARLLASRSRRAEAVPMFQRAFTAALESGVTPRVDWVARQAFQQSPQGLVGWRHLLAGWRAKATRDKSVPALLGLLQAAALNPQMPMPPLAAVTPSDIPVTVAVARRLLTMNRIGGARRLIAGALKATKTPGPQLLELGALIAEREGRDAEAAALLERALAARLEGSVPLSQLRAWYVRAMGVHVRLAATGDATAVEAALRLGARWRIDDPDNAQREQLCAQLLFTTGDDSRAMRHLTTIVERHPMDGDAHGKVAETLEHQGRFVLAQQYWRSAASAEPTNPNWLIRDAQIEMSRGDPAKAKALYRRVDKGKWQDRYAAVVSKARRALKQLRKAEGR